MKLIVTLFTALLFTSCSSYINKIHNELDRQDGVSKRRKIPRRYDTFSQFRKRPSSRMSTRNRKYLPPKTKRNYRPQASKRVTASDLVDNSRNSGSLWAGSGNENYLFTKNRWKRNGDIVLINVQTKLKQSISAELKRAFPAMPKKKLKKDDKPPSPANTAPQPIVAENNTGGDQTKIHDKISSVIVEEISKDHLLVRGQKFLLYKNRKHLIELQALIARRDIMDDDTVNSNEFLESSVTVLR